MTATFDAALDAALNRIDSEQVRHIVDHITDRMIHGAESALESGRLEEAVRIANLGIDAAAAVNHSRERIAVVAESATAAVLGDGTADIDPASALILATMRSLPFRHFEELRRRLWDQGSHLEAVEAITSRLGLGLREELAPLAFALLPALRLIVESDDDDRLRLAVAALERIPLGIDAHLDQMRVRLLKAVSTHLRFEFSDAFDADQVLSLARTVFAKNQDDPSILRAMALSMGITIAPEERARLVAHLLEVAPVFAEKVLSFISKGSATASPGELVPSFVALLRSGATVDPERLVATRKKLMKRLKSDLAAHQNDPTLASEAGRMLLEIAPDDRQTHALVAAISVMDHALPNGAALPLDESHHAA